VIVSSLDSIEIAGEEKRQVLLPIEALASGNSGLLAQLTNLDNKPVGYPVNISLNLSVISPITTWITLGAAVLLIVAAMVQSWRRVRRRKNV
jgi:cytochrome oxidase assembly protein ShyY1